MVLSDRSIREALSAGRVAIDPFDESCLQPASVDLRLDSVFRVFRHSRHAYIDLAQDMDDLTEVVDASENGPFMLHPGEFVLGSTLERVTLGHDIVGRLEGKSSLGRLGLLTHVTAGFCDPGFSGYLTLELSNVSNLPITLYKGMRVGQISFFEMTTPAARPYGSAGLESHYQDQRGPTPSRYRLDEVARRMNRQDGSAGVSRPARRTR
jgi:dCTP deaminase